MPTSTYLERRGQLLTYFDRTAVEAWKRLTSDAPVGRIRATVRAGRERMRQTLLGWLPDELHGRCILDAGCGTGTLAVELARRGATVVAIDLSPTLVSLARERVREQAVLGTVEFRVGDMLDPALGAFDHVVAMDSLIHYPAPDMVRALVALAERTRQSVVVTFAPRTLPLAVMHQIGRAFPRRDRAPAIEPVAPSRLLALLAADPDLASWRIGRSARIAHGFYTSQGLELRRA